MKLTRKQIKEGLEANPIDTLLLGSPKTLTKKQKDFAEALAMTGNKAEAYRQAYDTHSSPNIQSLEGQRLAKNPIIALQVEAIKLSLEAQKYLLPAHLRALTIQKLTEKALDPDVNHAQQIKALELLGKITEVSLFSERKEIITTDTSASAKDKLIQSLAQAIRSSSNITSAKKAEADQLLNEITGGNLANPNPETIDNNPSAESIQEAQDEAPSISESASDDMAETLTPPTPMHHFSAEFQATPTHTIPDKQSAPITETPPLSFTNTEWEGVDNFWETFEKVPTETPPLSDLGSHPTPIDIPDANWREE
jgi:phage terminase small subunit